MRGSRSASRTPEPHTEITKDTESRETRITRMSRIARSAFECGAAAPRWLFEPQRTQRTRRTGQNLQNVISQKLHRFDIRTSSLLRHSAFGISAHPYSVAMRWQRNQTKSQNFATTFFKKILTQPSRFLVKACSHPTMCAHRYTQRIVPGNSQKSRGTPQ
jgi:hypothetical protein